MFEATGMWLRRGEEATVEAAGVGGGVGGELQKSPRVAQPQRGPRSLVF